MAHYRGVDSEDRRCEYKPNLKMKPLNGREPSKARGGPPLHMKFSRDAAIPRIPAPHLLKQGQLQLAGASFREKLLGPSRSGLRWCTRCSRAWQTREKHVMAPNTCEAVHEPNSTRRP